MFNGRWPDSDSLVREMGKKSPAAILSFSGGKDSVCSYLQMRPHFERIALVFHQVVPGLEFVERGLRYFEELWGVKIVRVAGRWLHSTLRNGVYQTWERWQAICDYGVPHISHEDVRQGVAALNMGLDPDGVWQAVGTRASDSVIRNMRFRKYGPLSEKDRTFFPIWDWNKKRVIDTIVAAGVKLPEEYHVFGRTFDALSHRFLKGIRDNWPDDYRRILDYFPMAEAELLRYEFSERRKTGG